VPEQSTLQFSMMMDDPHAELRDRVFQTVLEGPGESDPAIRKAAAEGTGVPAELQSLIEKVHAHAYKVTDEDVARVQATYGDDRMFEIIVSAALGASRKRLIAGLNALDEA
jgi:predicted RNA polymerase sigma factor